MVFPVFAPDTNGARASASGAVAELRGASGRDFRT